MNKVAAVEVIFILVMLLGAQGMVGGTFNYAAPIHRRLIDAFKSGDLALAREQPSKSYRLIGFIRSQPADFHGVAKAIMRIIGADCGKPRPPIRAFPDGQVFALFIINKGCFFFFYFASAESAFHFAGASSERGNRAIPHHLA